jgi:Ca-activated chloride channel family protein
MSGMNPVNLALVLALDCSASVYFDEFNLLANGSAAGLRDAAVRQGLLGPPFGASLLSLLLWSGAGAQAVAVDWTLVSTQAELDGFAGAVEGVSRVVPAGQTAIGEALLAAEKLLALAPRPTSRRVIDVAGDGSSNQGAAPGPIRDRLAGEGVTINGLCVLHAEPDLVESYTREVIGGVGAFALACQDYQGFAVAMRQKLVREIA